MNDDSFERNGNGGNGVPEVDSSGFDLDFVCPFGLFERARTCLLPWRAFNCCLLFL